MHSGVGDHILFWHGFHLDPSSFNNLAGSFDSIVTYPWYASVCHLPNIFMYVSRIPASMDKVEAPIKKLWVL